MLGSGQAKKRTKFSLKDGRNLKQTEEKAED
jgi:hypothetical protein